MIAINLFDSNFAGSACSIAGQTPHTMRYVRNQTEWDGITVFTDEWINNPIVDEVKSRWKIGWLREPQCLHPETYRRSLVNSIHKFDTVLTYYRPLLDRFPSLFCFAPYGGTWIERPYWGIHPKRKLVSMLVGAKRSTDGHRLRQEIAERYEGIDYYGVKGTPVGYGAATKRQVLSQYYFTIVGETCSEHNLFTEILLDCFMVGTIPIFWGLPNLPDFFNPAGVLPFRTAEDIGQILPLLSPALYRQMLPAVRDNLWLARPYAITEDWLVEHVFKEMIDG